MSGEDIGRKWRGSGEEVEIEWGIEWGRERVSIEDGRLEGCVEVRGVCVRALEDADGAIANLA